MKRTLLAITLGMASTLVAQENRPVKDLPPPVFKTSPPPPSEQVFVYDQQPGGARPVLVSPEQARHVLDQFKALYPTLGSPRMLMYVNRELVDEHSGMKLAERKERTQTSTTEAQSEFKADPNAPAPATTPSTIQNPSSVTIVGNVGNGTSRQYPGSSDTKVTTQRSTAQNSYKAAERTQATLADRQTVRDIERLFGRPLRMAGVKLADQRLATQLIPNGPLEALTTEGEQARKDREALSRHADVVVEILISSRPITVPEVSGPKTYNVPDIQATAIRLSDASILGQASASDIIGKDAQAAGVARNFDVREIAEATALALMEDMLLNSR